MSKRLDQTELNTAISTLKTWKVEHGALVYSVSFAGFMQAIDFVNRVAAFAEGANHHPDIDIRYNRVRLALVTHDEGGITQRDIDLATSINTLA